MFAVAVAVAVVFSAPPPDKIASAELQRTRPWCQGAYATDFSALTVVHDGQTTTRTCAARSTDDAAMTTALSDDPRLVAACEMAMSAGQQQMLSNPAGNGRGDSPAAREGSIARRSRDT